MSRKFFGTDGVRAQVGTAPMTPDWVMHLAWAVGRMLNNQGFVGGKVMIGKDTRISGYMLENAIVSGLSAAGIDAHLLGVIPTPGIAYFTRTFQAAAGFVVSASHNEYSDNGIKIFAQDGLKLSDEQELEIERYLEQPMKLVPSAELGKAYRVSEVRGRYTEFCKNSIALGLPFKRLKIVLDCANGATYAIAPDVFRELGAQVVTMACEPNGCNINAFCGSTHPESLQRRVREEQADLGIAFDGDGDRVILVDKFGRLVDGDLALYVIAKYRRFKGERVSDVVGTLMSNFGVEQAFSALDIRFHRANVGDRYVRELMEQQSALLGGESSGHIICLDRSSTGDGIVAALQVVAAMLEMGAALHELVADVRIMPQVMKNIKVSKKQETMAREAVQEAYLAAQSALDGQGRVLLRPSGTEPKIRVMAEGLDERLLHEVVENLSQIIEKESNYV